MSVVKRVENMADLINQNNLGANNNALNAGNNNLRPSKPFGLNVKVPERTIKQIGESVKSNAGAGINGIFSYLAQNENVFNGTVNKQLDNLFVQDFNTKQILKDADMHAGHHFEMDM